MLAPSAPGRPGNAHGVGSEPAQPTAGWYDATGLSGGAASSPAAAASGPAPDVDGHPAAGRPPLRSSRPPGPHERVPRTLDSSPTAQAPGAACAHSDGGTAPSVSAAAVRPSDDAVRAPVKAPGRPSSHERTTTALGQSQGASETADLSRSDQLSPSGSGPTRPADAPHLAAGRPPSRSSRPPAPHERATEAPGPGLPSSEVAATGHLSQPFHTVSGFYDEEDAIPSVVCAATEAATGAATEAAAGPPTDPRGCSNTETCKFLLDSAHGSQRLRTLFDTGASINIMSSSVARRLGVLRFAHQIRHESQAKQLVGAYNGTLRTWLALHNLQVSQPEGLVPIPPASEVWVAPGELPGGIDLILGQPYLTDQRASLNYNTEELRLFWPPTKNSRGRTTHGPPAPRLQRLTCHRHDNSSDLDWCFSLSSFRHFYKKHVKAQDDGFAGAIYVSTTNWNALQTLFGDTHAADQAMAVATTGCELPGTHPRDTSQTPGATPADPADVLQTSSDSLASYVAALPPDVQPEARDAVERILGTFGALFLGRDEPLPTRDPDRPWPADAHARIPLIDPAGKPPSLPLRRMSPDKLRLLYEDMAKLIDNGIIRLSSSPFGAPVLYACSPSTGKRRLCIDYRMLNDLTVKDTTPLPTIADLLAIVGSKKATYFSVLDLKAGYHQIPMAAADIHKTAFKTRYGLFEFLVMPFGLTNAPATFSRVMNSLLMPFLDDFVVAYLDDILVFSETLEQHEVHLQQVLGVLENNGMSLNLEKCKLFRNEVTFLNFQLKGGTVTVVPAYVEALRQFVATPPSDKTGVRRFLGVVNFYRQFIEKFADIAEPLIALTRGRVTFTWTKHCQRAVEALVDRLSTGPILRLPEDEPYLVYTDASDVAIGACLMQRDNVSRKPMPIAYFSRTLQGAERRYAAFDRELLAVLHAIEHFRPHLESRSDTVVFTDHKPLVEAIKAKDLSTNDRHARWITRITSFRVTVAYVPGEENRVADFLSRPPDTYVRLAPPGPPPAPAEQRDPHLDVVFLLPAVSQPARQNVLSEPSETDLSLMFRAATAHCEFYRAALAARGSKVPNASELNKQFFGVRFNELKVCPTTGFLFRLKPEREGLQHRQYIVPDDRDLRQRILTEMHTTAFTGGHLGRDKLFQRIAQTFWWPTMHADAADFVKSCSVCQAVKPSNRATPGLLKPIPIPDRPMQCITMDFVGPLPRTPRQHEYVLTVVDRMSKFMLLLPLRDITVESTVRALQRHYVAIWGLPANIVTDRGPQFMTNLWKTLWQALGTSLSFTAPYHPQADGQSERMNRTWKDMLRAFADREARGTWDLLLPSIQHAFNSSVHAGSKTSPFEVLFGYASRVPATIGFPQPTETVYLHAMEVYRKQAHRFLADYQKAMKASADRHRRDVKYQVGDRVLVDATKQHLTDARGNPRHKLDGMWWGPYTVTEVWDRNPNAVRVDFDPTTTKAKHSVINVSHLRPFHGSHDREVDDAFSRLLTRSMAEASGHASNDLANHRSLAASPAMRARASPPSAPSTSHTSHASHASHASHTSHNSRTTPHPSRPSVMSSPPSSDWQSITFDTNLLDGSSLST